MGLGRSWLYVFTAFYAYFVLISIIVGPYISVWCFLPKVHYKDLLFSCQLLRKN